MKKLSILSIILFLTGFSYAQQSSVFKSSTTSDKPARVYNNPNPAGGIYEERKINTTTQKDQISPAAKEEQRRRDEYNYELNNRRSSGSGSSSNRSSYPSNMKIPN